jgi:hypothetical protein
LPQASVVAGLYSGVTVAFLQEKGSAESHKMHGAFSYADGEYISLVNPALHAYLHCMLCHALEASLLLTNILERDVHQLA